MWNIADIPMILTKWSPIKEDTQSKIRYIPMWVTLKKVPYSMFSWNGWSFLASSVREPKTLHPETELCTNFDEAKVFVEADLSKELPKMHQFKIKEDVDVVVEFSYPWLPPRCKTCEKLEHLLEACVVHS